MTKLRTAIEGDSHLVLFSFAWANSYVIAWSYEVTFVNGSRVVSSLVESWRVTSVSL